MNYLVTDERGKLSKTATVYVITMILVWAKFIVSGVVVSAGKWFPHDISFGELDPALVAAMIAASGTIYAWRRGQDAKVDAKDDLDKFVMDLEKDE